MGRYKFYREHKYVSFAMNDLERLIAKTDFCSPEEVEKVAETLRSVTEMLKGHAQYENTALHTLLKNKGSPLYEEVEKDHEHYEATLSDIESLLKEVDYAEDRVEAGYQFYLAFRKFVGYNLLHLDEEETIVLPELQRLYTDEELKMVEVDTYNRMTPAQMVHMMQVLFPHMNPSDREAFLTDIKEAEPMKFAESWNAIQSEIVPEERSALMQKLSI